MVNDLISQIKNAYLAKKMYIELPYTKLSEDTCSVLAKRGFIENFKVFKNTNESWRSLRLNLKYDGGGNPALEDIQAFSRPGLKKYIKSKNITLVKGGRGMFIVSTSCGVMSGEEAKKKGLGGEFLCVVY